MHPQDVSPDGRDQPVQLRRIVRRPEHVAIGANHDGGAAVLRHPRGEQGVGLRQILNIAPGEAVRLVRLLRRSDDDPFSAEAAPQFARFGSQPCLRLRCGRGDEEAEPEKIVEKDLVARRVLARVALDLRLHEQGAGSARSAGRGR